MITVLLFKWAINVSQYLLPTATKDSNRRIPSEASQSNVATILVASATMQLFHRK